MTKKANNRKEFSIITVTYNCEKTLEKTILSVLNQTFTDYEYIIIDGQSTDNTIAIIKQYEEKLTYWTSEKDKGIYDAMNKGIRQANGRWIVFLNSGDLFASPATLQIVASESGNQTCDILYGDIYVEKKGLLIVRPAAEPCNKQRMYFCHQTAFTRTEIMKETPFDIRFKMSADLHFFKKCYYRGLRFKHIRKPLVIFDKHGISNTNRLSGLLDNVKVIRAIDSAPQKYLYLFRLYFVINRIRISALFKKKK